MPKLPSVIVVSHLRWERQSWLRAARWNVSVPAFFERDGNKLKSRYCLSITHIWFIYFITSSNSERRLIFVYSTSLKKRFERIWFGKWDCCLHRAFFLPSPKL